MNESSFEKNLTNSTNEKILFCRKCGSKLSENNSKCHVCGTVVAYHEENLTDTNNTAKETTLEITENRETSPKKNRTKIAIISVLSVIFIALISFAGVYWGKTLSMKQDINTINGCPEFYNIEFGMTATKASQQIELKHTAREGINDLGIVEIDDYWKNSEIYIDHKEVFYLFGKKTSFVFIGFDGKNLNRVLFAFSQNDYKLTEIVSLYKKIYGSPTEADTENFSWCGPKTTINIFENGNDIIVFYSITPNSQ
ncbi:MAG: hypothetical protein IJZ08_08745 [Clostridia bacterium]|nr:hypothetical protein [Clostridia bacterium]